MSIPLDNLYYYIERLCQQIQQERVIIYRFYPHGAKDFSDLKSLHEYDWHLEVTAPHVICNDQEPLNFDHYQRTGLVIDPLRDVCEKYNCYQHPNLRRTCIFDRSIILHSEQQSKEVEKYQNYRFIPVYYWSHAMISLDWFRFAQHLTQNKKVNKTFLIYNRAWAGTREYRIKFSELLFTNNLLPSCQTTFNPVDPDSNMHYLDHNFKNASWRPNVNFVEHFETSTATALSSADLNIHDYETTDIEVVLETLFDDARLHFTEKTLRPIAAAQPFVIVGAAHALEYLKAYGFKTFSSVWNESYDLISDPQQRLEAVIELMENIAGWDPQTKQQKLKQARAIAKYNKKLFFSKKFFNKIESELTGNLYQALTQLIDENTSSLFLEERKTLCQHLEIKNILTGKSINPFSKLLPANHRYQSTLWKPKSIMYALSCARKYYRRSLSKQT
jgi:hypothetical protein